MSRYLRYSGGDPLAPPVDLSEALDAIGRDVMAGTSPERAMREFLRRGGRARTGLDDLGRRIAQRRRDLLNRHSLDGTLQQVRDLLDTAVLEERKQLARDPMMDEDDRAFRQLELDTLPDGTAAAVEALKGHDWQSPQAREAYDKIRDLMGRELLDQRFAGMKQALENATDADRQRISDMLRDLNELLDKHRRGEDTQADFDEFMAEHGDLFPEHPRDIEELLDALAARSAAAQRMFNSMTPEQREELMSLSAQAFGSPDLLDQLSRMDQNLRALRPGEDWDGSENFRGEEGLELGEGAGVLSDLSDLDNLSDQLAQSHRSSSIDDIDLDALARQLGPQAAVDARALGELERALRDSGYLKRAPEGDLRLSPRALRELGRQLVRDLAGRLASRPGQRDARLAGQLGEPTGATRPWEFGDTEPWAATRTVTNAVLRTVGAGGSAAHGVRITLDDIEVTETEARTRAAVALLVDTSFSMAIEGRWVPMKRTALALHTLLRTRFRGDALTLIGFSRIARAMDIDELVGLDSVWDKGTNLHHGLLLANRFFRRHPDAQPILLVVTDGEPTAHLQEGGEVWFDYPPHPLTIGRTVEELDASRRLGARTTFFRLGTDPGLARLVDAFARRVDGHTVCPRLDDLGTAVVDSYLGSRRPGGGPA